MFTKEELDLGPDKVIIEAINAAEKLEFFGEASRFINELRRRWLPNA